MTSDQSWQGMLTHVQETLRGIGSNLGTMVVVRGSLTRFEPRFSSLRALQKLVGEFLLAFAVKSYV